MGEDGRIKVAAARRARANATTYVLRVCACDSLNVYAHVGMRGCVRVVGPELIGPCHPLVVDAGAKVQCKRLTRGAS
eukprot:341790-Prymnesium_polylepis.1